VAEGHCEVPRGCPWPSATLKFYKFYFFLSFTLYLAPALPPALPWRVKRDPNVKTRRIVWNGPGCAKCKPAMSYQKRPRDQNSAVLCETAPRYQNGPVLCKTGFSDKNVVVLCDNGQGPFWRSMSGFWYSQAPATPTLPGPCPQSYWVEDHSKVPLRTKRNYNIEREMQHFPSRNCSGGNLQARRENGREGSLEIYGTKAVNCSGRNLQARRRNGREGSLEISGTKAVVCLSVEVLKLKIGTLTDRQTANRRGRQTQREKPPCVSSLRLENSVC
jgi:hypothetical protein